jgi:ClpP class serine protease
VSRLRRRPGEDDAGVGGKFKTEMSPFQPLSEDAKAEIQARVDKFYGMFVQDVARGRGTTVDQVREGFGQGRMVTRVTL